MATNGTCRQQGKFDDVAGNVSSFGTQEPIIFGGIDNSLRSLIEQPFVEPEYPYLDQARCSGVAADSKEAVQTGAVIVGDSWTGENGPNRACDQGVHARSGGLGDTFRDTVAHGSGDCSSKADNGTSNYDDRDREELLSKAVSQRLSQPTPETTVVGRLEAGTVIGQERFLHIQQD